MSVLDTLAPVDVVASGEGSRLVQISLEQVAAAA